MSNNVEEGSKLKIGHWNSKIDRRCEDCDRDFFDIKEFEYHMAWHKHGEHYCEACDVYANCQKDYDLHLNGRKHQVRNKKYKDKNEHKEEMKNLRKANPNLSKYYCKVCNVYAYCQKTFDLHLNGRKHKENQVRIKKYRDKKVYKKEHKEEMKVLRKVDPNLSTYFCEVCKIYANCQKTYDLHLNGRKHKENQLRNEKNKPKHEYKFHCEVCDVYTHSQKIYDVHLAGQKHQKKIIEIANC